MAHTDYSKPVKEFAIPVHTFLYETQTISEALESLRKRKIDEKIIYFYVVNEEGELQGVVPTRTLLLKDSGRKIKDVMMRSVVRVREDQSLEEAMEILTSQKLLALPVVDAKQRLKGIIDVQLYLEESFDIANARHSSDVFQILGLTLEEGKHKGPWKSYRIRMPWIVCNMAGGIACAIISFFYKDVLARVVLLAMFIPLILTLSESISMQSMTQSLHFLRQPRISFKRIIQRVLLEGRMAILLAATCSVVVGLLSLLWDGGLGASLTIAVSLFFGVSISACVGASIPLILHAKSLDPKVASGPVVLMFADVITTMIYLSLGTWWLL